MIEKQINIHDLAVNYKVFGEQLPKDKTTSLLILHGWPSSSEKWIQVVVFNI
jgi:pimeloyl-ACP methyl ester carboxylesterase